MAISPQDFDRPIGESQTTRRVYEIYRYASILRAQWTINQFGLIIRIKCSRREKAEIDRIFVSKQRHKCNDKHNELEKTTEKRKQQQLHSSSIKKIKSSSNDNNPEATVSCLANVRLIDWMYYFVCLRQATQISFHSISLDIAKWKQPQTICNYICVQLELGVHWTYEIMYCRAFW